MIFVYMSEGAKRRSSDTVFAMTRENGGKIIKKQIIATLLATMILTSSMTGCGKISITTNTDTAAASESPAYVEPSYPDEEPVCEESASYDYDGYVEEEAAE